MKETVESAGLCMVCRAAVTTISAEVQTGRIYVCEKCLEKTKQNFIWICMQCGKVYVRPKSVVLARLSEQHLKEAYRVCEDLQIIQGIDRCIACAPEEIMEIMESAKSERGKGHC